jgi:hypothetical protein
MILLLGFIPTFSEKPRRPIVPKPDIKLLPSTFDQQVPKERIRTAEQTLSDLELVVGEAYAMFPPTQEIATELVQRVNQLAKVMDKHLPEDDRLCRVFGNDDPTATGCVGTNPEILKEIISGKGNLRETMTTGMAAISTFRPALKNTALFYYVSEIMKMYEKDPEQTRDWLQQELPFFDLDFTIEKEKTEIRERSRQVFDPKAKRNVFLPFAVPPKHGSVYNTRAVVNSLYPVGREYNSQPESDRFPLRMNQVRPPLGKYEKEFHLVGKPGSMDSIMKWRSGGGPSGHWTVPDYIEPHGIQRRGYSSNPEIRVPTEEGLPKLAGPSGTSDFFILAAKYLGFSKGELEMLKFGLLGWMVPARDHTAYEILQASQDEGIGMSKGKDTIATITHQTLTAPVQVNGETYTPQNLLDFVARVVEDRNHNINGEDTTTILNNVEQLYRINAAVLRQARGEKKTQPDSITSHQYRSSPSIMTSTLSPSRSDSNVHQGQ